MYKHTNYPYKQYYKINMAINQIKVCTSGPYVTGHAKHDQREFVWTLHKAHDEWESSSK